MTSGPLINPFSPRLSRPASVTSSIHSVTRRWSALPATEQGYDTDAVDAEREIVEEIEEIKRYEDFTTIDWVQDAARAQLRRRAKRQENALRAEINATRGWRRWLWDAYDAGQAWIVVTLVGMAIGLNAAFLSIVTEWLSDVKLGYCTSAFYLNENFCCWGAESGCPEWRPWTGFSLFNYVIYALFAMAFAFVAAKLVKTFAPYAAGSGISEIKCIIAGFVMKGFLGFWTLLIKSLGLPLAIASGLSVGKEGPTVHYAVCTGNVISRLFEKYRKDAAKTREILSASAAAGVGVAFGSPIGGVLFSLEEMSNYFPLKTMWRSYFCALVATAVLAALNPFRTGQLVMFQVSYDRSWHFFEIIFYIIIGIFGGLYGAFVIKWHLRVQSFRKKYLSEHPIYEAAVLAGITAMICFPNMFLRIDMTESMEILFRECEGDYDYNKLCEASYRWSMIFSLALATIIRTGFVILSYGCKVPAGIFVPSMAIGASFGRMIGIFVQAMHETFPNAKFFSACQPDVPCITPGTYAFLGAGAALSGIMHITVSVVVIMFELTGALTYILPTMIVVGVTKAVSNRMSKGGIADRMIAFNGFPFPDNKEDHSFGVPVSTAMTTNPQCITSGGTTIQEIEHLLSDGQYQGYPIVDDQENKTLLGYIGTTELLYAINRIRKTNGAIAPTASVSFTAGNTSSHHHNHQALRNSPTLTFDAMEATGGAQHVNFSRFVDVTPITVHPKLPLETALEIFKKMGPRVILVEHRGKLTGLITVKDVLKYQLRLENPRGDGSSSIEEEAQQERVWRALLRCGAWVRGKARWPWVRRRRTVVLGTGGT